MESSNAVLEVAADSASEVVARAMASKGKKKVAGRVANIDGISAYETKRGVRFLAQVRLAGRKPVSKSFDSRELAVQWKREQEASLSADKVQVKLPSKLAMREVFDMYVKGKERVGQPLPAHQVMMFNRLMAHPAIKDVLISEMCYTVMRDYCIARKHDGVHPSTVQAEYARVAVSIEWVAEDAEWGENYVHPLAGVRKRLMAKGFIADSRKRSRRPSAEEQAALVAFFAANPAYDRAGKLIPMGDIIEFAALNAFRRGEITELKWSELDVKAQVIVCHRKDSESEGGKREALVPVRAKALEIVKRQPRVDGEDRIFPFSGDTIGGAFGRACDKINAERGGKFCADLHFHDLRHEAITNASQVAGVTQAQLKAFSGHKSDRHLNRYINLTKENVSSAARILS